MLRARGRLPERTPALVPLDNYEVLHLNSKLGTHSPVATLGHIITKSACSCPRVVLPIPLVSLCSRRDSVPGLATHDFLPLPCCGNTSADWIVGWTIFTYKPPLLRNDGDGRYRWCGQSFAMVGMAPIVRGVWTASKVQVYEHGRWRLARSSEDIDVLCQGGLCTNACGLRY